MHAPSPTKRESRWPCDRRIELLGAVPLFRACTDKELKRIAGIADVLEVPEGEVLTKEGRPGEEFFVIAEGKARVSLRGDELAELGPGDFFGEMALLDEVRGQRRSRPPRRSRRTW